MQLVFVHGPPAAGKLTVARELVELTGFRLFHNHLTVDLVGALFEFGSEPFVKLRESIWLDCFNEAATSGQSLIFTFAPERTVRGDFPRRVVQGIEARGGQVVFVELTCPDEEIERRIEDASRAEFVKLRSVSEYRRLRDSGAFEFPPLPEPLLRLDTSRHSAREAAELVASRLTGSGE